MDEKRLRRYGGWAALTSGTVWGLGLLCFILFFTIEAGDALAAQAHGLETFALFGFLSDLLPIFAFPATVALALIFYQLERAAAPRLGIVIALLGIAGMVISTAGNILTVLGQLEVAEGARVLFIAYGPYGLWFLAVHAVARRAALLPTHVTVPGIAVGLGELIGFAVFVPFGLVETVAGIGIEGLRSNYLLLAAVVVGGVGAFVGWLGPLVWAFVLGRALLASAQPDNQLVLSEGPRRR